MMNYMERDIVQVTILQEIIHTNNPIIMIQKNRHNLIEEQTIIIRIINKIVNLITSMIF